MRAEEVEELICLISSLDRASVIQQFATYRANFPIDFTRDFLEAQTTDRLRHLLLAVCVQSKRPPSMETTQAA